MMHALDIFCVNSHIIYNSFVHENGKLEHKDFVMAIVDKLLDRATHFLYQTTRSYHEKIEALTQQVPNDHSTCVISVSIDKIFTHSLYNSLGRADRRLHIIDRSLNNTNKCDLQEKINIGNKTIKTAVLAIEDLNMVNNHSIH